MEKRVSKRKPVRRPARIYRPDRSPICGCVVRDISETGVRLNFEKCGCAMEKIPAQFILSFTPDEDKLSEKLSVTRTCETVWIADNQLGAFFKGRRKFADRCR